MKVGDYVKTKRRTLQTPQIARIKSMKKDSGYKNQYYIELDHNLIPYYNFHIYEEDVELVKESPIDLIGVGDYVNGKRVEWVGYDLYRENEDGTLTGIGEKRILFNEFTKDSVREKGIKSIVTKEQFKSMEYRL